MSATRLRIGRPGALATAFALICLLGLAPRAMAAAPTVGTPSATNVQGTAALLKASVDPEGLATSARFEYVTEAQFGASGFAGASLTPLRTLGPGSAPVIATAQLSGLTPSTTYRFRARATNADGNTNGAEGTLTTTAGFGFLPGAAGFSAAMVEKNGSPANRAGTHPYALEMSFDFRLAGEADGQPGVPFTDGDLRDLKIEMPPGVLINPTALEVPDRKDTFCNHEDFHTPRQSPFQDSLSGENCPGASQVGVVAVRSSHDGGSTRYFGIFSLVPRHGAPMSLGFSPFGTPIELVPRIREGDAALVFEVENFPQRLDLYGLDISLWGTPWPILPAPPSVPDAHVFERDNERGDCLNEEDRSKPFGKPAEYKWVDEASGPPPKWKLVYQAGTCSIGDPTAKGYEPKSLLTLPIACEGPIAWQATATSWQQQTLATASAQSPGGITACNKTLATARIALTTDAASSATGLDFVLDVNDGGGLTNPGGIVRPPIKRAVVELPEGLVINPSVGSGLGVCSPEEFEREQLATAPGAGCPNPSKIGDISVEGVLGLPTPIQGSLHVASPYQNPSGTLLALYIVIRSGERGLFFKAHGKVEPDPRTGRLRATFENLPQIAYTAFKLRFREGQRAVMVSPGACGSHASQITLTPWPVQSPVVANSSAFQIARGEVGGPCPTGALRPFNPRLVAGSLNPNASSYSPFTLHMTRSDAEQQITSYSATFPKGLLAKIAGVPFCPDSAIAAAVGRSSAAEAASPSCPAQSQIGRTLAGYGIGRVLAYAPGTLHLAGPYNGAPLSTVAITRAVVGPFDLGTVVVRSAIRIERQSAVASIDASGSDPIPHILSGIPLHLRDIRVYVDRPNFTINPTTCDPLTVASRLSGAGNELFSSADDVFATATDRFQLLGCSALAFKPRLSFRHLGKTNRGAYPTLKVTMRTRPGDAGIAKVQAALPPSLFLAQEHIETICTRSQYQADRCPRGSVYGRARATTPLMDEPMEGPVYLRSSDNPLPDLVIALSGRGVKIDVVGRIDTYRGGLRGTFDVLPDAPVAGFAMTLRGGKRGVLANAENICAKPQLATVRIASHSNVGELTRPRLINPACKQKHKAKGKTKKRGKR